jgi:uncharacterized membrane protein
MDNAYMSAVAALAGSAIGALASFATTWQPAHERAQRFAQAMARRYALVGKLRLFASASVISKAEEVMRRIVETYNLPIEIFVIRKTGRSTTLMCFGRLAKLAVKTCAFR